MREPDHDDENALIAQFSELYARVEKKHITNRAYFRRMNRAGRLLCAFGVVWISWNIILAAEHGRLASMILQAACLWIEFWAMWMLWFDSGAAGPAWFDRP